MLNWLHLFPEHHFALRFQIIQLLCYWKIGLSYSFENLLVKPRGFLRIPLEFGYWLKFLATVLMKHTYVLIIQGLVEEWILSDRRKHILVFRDGWACSLDFDWLGMVLMGHGVIGTLFEVVWRNFVRFFSALPSFLSYDHLSDELKKNIVFKTQVLC